MSSMLSKRQQARNERILHDLIKNVPGNDKCADCSTKNPAWASWSLGVFLCIRCASLHRKLGTHVSKVKSISMDTWTNEQVENMRKNGNVNSNAFFNPDPRKHPAPLSQDDTDYGMEKHIRSKYEFKTYRQGPAQPPRPSSSSGTASFGAGISPPASSLSPSSTREKASTISSRPKEKSRPGLGGLFRSTSPKNNLKVNQILGTKQEPYRDGQSPNATIKFPHGMVSPTKLELFGDQIKSLREMGFTDVTQCVEVLQQTDGKMMDAVEVLIRLNRTEEKRPEPPPKQERSQSDNPGHRQIDIKQGGGVSHNPFEGLDKEAPHPPPPAQQLQAAPSMELSMSYPGNMPHQHGQLMAVNLYSSSVPAPWNGMANGYAGQQHQHQSSFQMSHLAQAISPTSPNPFSQLQSPASYQHASPTGSTVSSYNPFLQTSRPVLTNPYMAQSQPNLLSPLIFSAPSPHTQDPNQDYLPPTPMPTTNNNNQTYGYNIQATSAYTTQNQHLHSQQPTNSTAKDQILALYNIPGVVSATVCTPPPVPIPAPAPAPAPPTMPEVGSKNPFLPPAAPQARSRESTDFGAWQSGRHSPDAFASLAFAGDSGGWRR